MHLYEYLLETKEMKMKFHFCSGFMSSSMFAFPSMQSAEQNRLQGISTHQNKNCFANFAGQAA